jgi:hypothetical protein
MSENSATPDPTGPPAPIIRMGEVGRFLVPMDEDDIVAWFLEHLFLGQGLRERLAGTAAAGSSPGWLGRLAFDRCWTLEPPMGAAPTVAPASRSDEWGRLLARSGAAFSRPDSPLGTPPDPGRCIFARDRRGSGRGNLIAFVFGAQDGGPLAVAKIRLARTGVQSLRAEWAALRRLHAELPPRFSARIPRPMAFRRQAGVVVLVGGLVPGRTPQVDLYQSLNPSRLPRRHLAAALDWLVEFQAATRLEGSHFRPDRDLPVGHGDEVEPPWLRALWERCARDGLPLTAVHGDFRSANVLLGRQVDATDASLPDFCVVDWERYRPVGSPFTDLFDFALSYVLGFPWSRYRRRAPLQAFRLGFLSDNVVSREVRTFLMTYCERTGADPRVLAPLARIHLLERARQGPYSDIWLQCEQLLARSSRSIVSAE